MTEAGIYALLAEIFREVFPGQDIRLAPELCSRDVSGWDSLRQVEILVAAENRLQLQFTSREIDSLQNVGDLVRVIGGKLAGRGP